MARVKKWNAETSRPQQTLNRISMYRLLKKLLVMLEENAEPVSNKVHDVSKEAYLLKIQCKTIYVIAGEIQTHLRPSEYTGNEIVNIEDFIRAASFEGISEEEKKDVVRRLRQNRRRIQAIVRYVQ